MKIAPAGGRHLRSFHHHLQARGPVSPDVFPLSPGAERVQFPLSLLAQSQPRPYTILIPMTINNAPEQLRAAIQALEKVAADRTLMAGLSPEEYARLLKAAGEVLLPDPKEKRRFIKARIRKQKLEKLQRE